jgi:FMN phosphatase YigB (HAD superfamily)
LLRAALIDVGGTLLPDNLPQDPALGRLRRERLAELLPGLGPDALDGLLAGLLADARAGGRQLEQRTNEEIRRRLVDADPALGDCVDDVRRTLARNMGWALSLFPGCREFLAAAGELGLRRILVTNTAWFDDEDWRVWREPELGLTGLVDGIVTSVSVGYRKPHPAMFERALELAGCSSDHCVFIGNREDLDVEPALELGMTVIRVAIHEAPTPTRAHRLVTSLAEAADALRALCVRAGPPPPRT